MTKILMTSVRDDEQAAIDAYANQHKIQIITSPALLENVLDQTKAVDGVVIQQRDPLPATVYPTLRENGLRQITTRTAGYDMIDLDLAHQNSLKITNVPAYSPRSVAEHALMQIFRVLRKTPEVDRRVAENDYRWPGLQAKEIHTTTIGIIGVGRIGGTLATLLHALGAKVLGYDVKPRDEMKEIVEYVDKDTLLENSDVVSLHVDLNPTSEGLLTKPDFNRMKQGASLINASRGPVVNTADLISALKDGPLSFAALDTVEGEGEVFNADHRQDGIAFAPLVEELHKLNNVILTPHIAFFTNTAVQNMVDTSLDDALAILNGQESPHEIKG